MDIYVVLLFLHIAASIAMFCGWAIEAAALWHQNASSPAEHTLPGVNRFAALAPMGMLLTLFTGLAMMAWRWEIQGWMLVAILAIGILIVGGILFERSAAAHEPDQPSNAVGLRRLSLALRIGIGLAILALMIVRPDLVTSAALLTLGAMAGWLSNRGFGVAVKQG